MTRALTFDQRQLHGSLRLEVELCLGLPLLGGREGRTGRGRTHTLEAGGVGPLDKKKSSAKEAVNFGITDIL